MGCHWMEHPSAEGLYVHFVDRKSSDQLQPVIPMQRYDCEYDIDKPHDIKIWTKS